MATLIETNRGYNHSNHGRYLLACTGSSTDSQIRTELATILNPAPGSEAYSSKRDLVCVCKEDLTWEIIRPTTVVFAINADGELEVTVGGSN